MEIDPSLIGLQAPGAQRNEQFRQELQQLSNAPTTETPINYAPNQQTQTWPNHAVSCPQW